VPFFSYGGTALITELAAVGLLYNIATTEPLARRLASGIRAHGLPYAMETRAPVRMTLEPILEAQFVESRTTE